jgi:hypothetical protein
MKRPPPTPDNQDVPDKKKQSLIRKEAIIKNKFNRLVPMPLFRFLLHRRLVATFQHPPPWHCHYRAHQLEGRSRSPSAPHLPHPRSHTPKSSPHGLASPCASNCLSQFRIHKADGGALEQEVGTAPCAGMVAYETTQV